MKKFLFWLSAIAAFIFIGLNLPAQNVGIKQLTSISGTVTLTPISGSGSTVDVAATNATASSANYPLLHSNGPVNVIIEVAGADWENMPYAAIAAAWHKNGIIKLLAVGLDAFTYNTGVTNLPCMSAVLNYYGAAGVPVGMITNTLPLGSAPVNPLFPSGIWWQNWMITNQGISGSKNTNFEVWVKTLRRALASCPPHTLSYIDNNPATVLQSCLANTNGDEISPLPTLTLFNNALRPAPYGLINGAGFYPHSAAGTPEYDMQNSVAAEQWLQTNVHGIMWLGNNLGGPSLTAPPATFLEYATGTSNYIASNNPVKNILYNTQPTGSGDTGRPAWGGTMLMIAAYGQALNGTSLFTLIGPGSNQIYAGGSNFFNTSVNNSEWTFTNLNWAIESNLVNWPLYASQPQDDQIYQKSGFFLNSGAGAGLFEDSSFFNATVLDNPSAPIEIGSPGFYVATMIVDDAGQGDYVRVQGFGGLNVAVKGGTASTFVAQNSSPYATYCYANFGAGGQGTFTNGVASLLGNLGAPTFVNALTWPYSFTNVNSYSIETVFQGGTTTTNVTKNGSLIASPLGANVPLTVHLQPGEYLTFTGSGSGYLRWTPW